MRAALLLSVLLVAAAAGCVGTKPAPPREVAPADLGYDASALHVTGTELVNTTIASWDGGTDLATVIRVPVTNDTLADGSAARWPVVVFLHGWGEGKESYTGGRGGVPGSEAMGGTDRLLAYAQAGFIAVAYDARGFGQSTGYADVAGPASMADLDSVIDWVAAHYATNGKVGILGASYGGGEALQAWAKDPRVTTVVPMYGWTDLADALIPNNVPKLEWAQFLYGYGLVGAHGRYDAMITEWYTQLYTRTDLATVRAQMAERSVAGTMGSVQKPLFLCQGLQESLFPQADQAWSGAGGFTRAYVYTGGHGSSDDGCWSRAMDWFQFFLSGYDTRVDAWPALQTVDAGGQGGDSYTTFPNATWDTYHLRAPDLVQAASDATFTVRQSASATLDPSALPDLLGGPRPPLPDELRNDPSATLFTTPAFDAPRTLLGAPTLHLSLQSGTPPFQVAAELLVLRADGTSVALGHAAYAALNQTDLPFAPLPLRFEWTHAVIGSGDRLQLRVAANDPGWWVPLAADYSVVFGGESTLELPFQM